MRILYSTNQLDMGGIETNLVRLATVLTEKGHDVVVASRGGMLVPALVAAGGRHVELSLRFRSPTAVASDVRALRRVLADFAPDVVHAMSASTTPLISGVARFRSSGRPRVLASPMGLTTHPNESRVRVLARAYATTMGADTVIAISPAIERTLRRLPVGSARIARGAVVGVEDPRADLVLAEARRSVREELGLPIGETLISTVGRLDPSKSHHLFIQAADHARRQGIAATWVIVGGGRLGPSLEREISCRGLGRAVRLVGEREDAQRFIAASDVYVRPGVVEGFVGITTLEAQALGVPVVSFDTEDVKMAIEDRTSGVLVPPGDTRALAAAVAEVLADPGWRRSLGEAGRDRWSSTFSIGAVVEALLEVYRGSPAAESRPSREAD